MILTLRIILTQDDLSDLTTSPPTETPSSPLGELDVSLLLSAVWDRGVSRALGGGRVGDVIGRHHPGCRFRPCPSSLAGRDQAGEGEESDPKALARSAL